MAVLFVQLVCIAALVTISACLELTDGYQCSSQYRQNCGIPAETDQFDHGVLGGDWDFTISACEGSEWNEILFSYTPPPQPDISKFLVSLNAYPHTRDYDTFIFNTTFQKSCIFTNVQPGTYDVSMWVDDADVYDYDNCVCKTSEPGIGCSCSLSTSVAIGVVAPSNYSTSSPTNKHALSSNNVPDVSNTSSQDNKIGTSWTPGHKRKTGFDVTQSSIHPYVSTYMSANHQIVTGSKDTNLIIAITAILASTVVITVIIFVLLKRHCVGVTGMYTGLSKRDTNDGFSNSDVATLRERCGYDATSGKMSECPLSNSRSDVSRIEPSLHPAITIIEGTFENAQYTYPYGFLSKLMFGQKEKNWNESFLPQNANNIPHDHTLPQNANNIPHDHTLPHNANHAPHDHTWQSVPQQEVAFLPPDVISERSDVASRIFVDAMEDINRTYMNRLNAIPTGVLSVEYPQHILHYCCDGVRTSPDPGNHLRNDIACSASDSSGTRRFLDHDCSNISMGGISV